MVSNRIVLFAARIALSAFVLIIAAASVAYIQALALVCAAVMFGVALFGKAFIYVVGFVTATGALWAAWQIVLLGATELHRLGV